jgi:pimeloyl-ACP methyl ester carboxylesterase
MIKKILIGILGTIILIAAAVFVFYLVDKSNRLAQLESGSRLAETPAGTIEYKITGEKGLAAIQIHGTSGGYDDPLELMDGFRVITLSRPGYLRTPLDVGKTPVEQAKAYSALLDFLDIDRTVVIGTSGGGPSAISFASLFPEKTIALIGLEPVSQPMFQDGEVAIPIFLKSDFLSWIFCSLMQYDALLKQFNKSSDPSSTSEQIIFKDPEKIEMAKKSMWLFWPSSKRMTGIENDIKQFQTLSLNISDIKVPTLIIHGFKDNVVPVSQSKKLAELIPDSRLEIIGGADHQMLITHTEELKKIVNEFVKNVGVR